jgi:hypothetical protein
VNCNINESSVFSKPEFQELFRPYGLVKLYTDVIPDHYYAPALLAKLGDSIARRKADASLNSDFEANAFGTRQLPLYVILEPKPNGKIEIVGVYDEGKINDEAAFAKFLKEPQGDAGGLRAQVGGK